MLEPNDDIIADGELPIERLTADGLLTKEIHLPQGRFYVGHVTSDPESHVAVREANNKGQLVRLATTKQIFGNFLKRIKRDRRQDSVIFFCLLIFLFLECSHLLLLRTSTK